MHGAASKGHKETAELLIANDSDVNALSVNGNTPLDYANDEISDPSENTEPRRRLNWNQQEPQKDSMKTVCRLALHQQPVLNATKPTHSIT